jgi:hypothetical protein
MTAPAPYDGVAGRVSLGQIAQNIVAHYKWVYRWSNEIGADAALNPKKLAQLAFQHCRLIRELIQPFLPLANNAPFVRALVSEFAWSGMEWATLAEMRTDLAGIYQKCGELFTHTRDNVPEVRTFAQRAFDDNGQEVEQITDIAKNANAAVAQAVTLTGELRALFA